MRGERQEGGASADLGHDGTIWKDRVDLTHGLLEGEAGVPLWRVVGRGDVDKVDLARAAVTVLQKVDLPHAQRAVAVVQHADLPRRHGTCMYDGSPRGHPPQLVGLCAARTKVHCCIGMRGVYQQLVLATANSGCGANVNVSHVCFVMRCLDGLCEARAVAVGKLWSSNHSKGLSADLILKPQRPSYCGSPTHATCTAAGEGCWLRFAMCQPLYSLADSLIAHVPCSWQITAS